MAREFHVDRHIGGKGETREQEAAIATLATRQDGVVSHLQLVAIGLGDDAIAARLRGKRLHQVHRGVYAVGHRRLTRTAQLRAAVLFAGEGAVLSHRSAAVLWELRSTKEGQIDVIAPVHRRGDRIVRIRQNALGPDEITTCQGIPVTTATRTIVDLASCVTQPQLEQAIRQAVYRKLTTTAALAEAVERNAGRRGIKALRQALLNLGEAPGITRSRLEERFLRFLRKHALPMPDELNALMRVGPHDVEADCVWHEQRVVAEIDGRDAHDSTPAFESDRERDLGLTARGWKPIRITSRRMRFDSETLARELRALL